MGKIENLEKYIEMCEDDFFEIEDKLSFIKEVEGIYTNEIERFRTGLNLYEEFLIGESEIDFEGDIKRIKNKLINYKDNLE